MKSKWLFALFCASVILGFAGMESLRSINSLPKAGTSFSVKYATAPYTDGFVQKIIKDDDICVVRIKIPNDRGLDLGILAIASRADDLKQGDEVTIKAMKIYRDDVIYNENYIARKKSE